MPLSVNFPDKTIEQSNNNIPLNAINGLQNNASIDLQLFLAKSEENVNIICFNIFHVIRFLDF